MRIDEQPEVARMVNDAYAAEIAKRPDRLKGFASIFSGNALRILNNVNT